MLIIARTDFWLLALVLSSAWLLTEYTLAAPAGRPRLSDATLSDTSPAPPPPLSITSSAELCHILANHLDATACARLARVWPDFRETVLHRMTDTRRGAAGKVVTASDSESQTISTLFNEINVITAADGLWKALDRLWYMSRGTEEQSSKFHQQIAVRLSYHHRALLSWRESSPRSISEIFHGMETAVTAIAALENFFFAEEDAAACEEYLAARFPESVHMSGTICCGPALYTKWRHVWKLVRRDLEGTHAVLILQRLCS